MKTEIAALQRTQWSSSTHMHLQFGACSIMVVCAIMCAGLQANCNNN